MTPAVRIATGAELRITNGSRDRMVVCVNGGQAAPVEGTWSASLEWLVRALAPRFPRLGFAEVRYRVKSWQRLELCIEDARAAIREAGGERTLLVGFSMGGAVAIACADEATVERVVGLAPWIPDRMPVDPIRGKRLDVIHGSLDAHLPGVPGVSPAHSRRSLERVRAVGAAGDYTLIPGGLHGIAVRSPGGRALALPRARAWERLLAAQLEAFRSPGSSENMTRSTRRPTREL